ncbi:WSC-domain-containing protein, partial [Auricularia subglabra TFB-10046 SS5]
MSLIQVLALSTLAVSAVRSAAVQVAVSGPWVASGCHNAVLTTSINSENDTVALTIESCLDSCYNSGVNGFPYQYGGVKDGDRCVCGNTLQPGSFALDAGQCDLSCPGNRTQLCGGPGATQLYELNSYERTAARVPAKVGAFSSAGCVTDAPGARALRNYFPTAAQISLEDCVDLCDSHGFILAGTEYSHECFCGNALLGQNTPEPAARCNMACEGNPSQVCGGNNAISLYSKAPFTRGVATIPRKYEDWSFQFCASDGVTRSIPDRLNLDADKMTVSLCLNACAAANYTVAALQYGQECWCGNDLPVERTANALCNFGCSANANQFCGGSLVNQVYSRGDY